MISIKDINDPRGGWIHPDLGHVTIKVRYIDLAVCA